MRLFPRSRPHRHPRLTAICLSAWLLLCIGMLLYYRITRGPPKPGTAPLHHTTPKAAH